MEYQKITNLLDNTQNQPSKFRTKNCVEINDDSGGAYNTSQIKFKTSMLKSSLRDYSDACILLKRTITNVGAGENTADRPADRINKQVVFKN